MQAFFDESGGLGQSDTFVIAGLFFEDSKLPAFIAEWSSVMANAPSVDVFKAKEAAGMSGGFRRLSPEERDQKVRALAKCVRVHATSAIHCTLHLPGFQETIANSTKPFCYPYFWPFHIIVMASCFELFERGERTPCKMVFDTQKIFGPKAQRWFPVVRAAFSDDPEVCIMPDVPLFADDKSCMPLQAADMLAWVMRSSTTADWPAYERLVEGDGIAHGNVRPHPFEVTVGEELCRMPLSRHSQFLTPNRLRGIRDKTVEFLRDGTVAAYDGTELGNLARAAMRRRQ